jgi:hypothetical protein
VDSELGIFGGVLGMVAVTMTYQAAYYILQAVVDGAFHIGHFAARFKQEDFRARVEGILVAGAIAVGYYQFHVSI